MSKCDSSCFVLCYTRFSPLAIEITCIIISITGEIITQFGLKKIAFIEDDIDKILYVPNVVFFIFILIFNIIIIFLRYLDLINSELNLLGYTLSLIEIIISFCGILMNLLDVLVFIIHIDEYPKFLNTVTISCSIIVIWYNIFLMAITDNWIINMKIKGSYHNYEMALEDEKKFIDIQNKKDELETNFDDKDATDIKVKSIIDKNKNIKNSKKDENKINNNNINNYINNNININIKIDNSQKNSIFSSVNASLKASNNNLDVNLKNNEENKI